MTHDHNCHCGHSVNSDAPVLVNINNVCYRRNGRDILDKAALEIRRGDFIAVTGPNGGGKTTLLRLMLGLAEPTSGTVTYPHGKPRIGYLPQKSAIDARFPLTVRELVASGYAGPRAVLPGTDKTQGVNDMLNRLELDDRADYTLGMLSGGQLQRALLGRALVSQPELLVLDEPLSYLDSRFVDRFYDIMRSLPGGTSVVLVSHDMTVLAGMATRHVIVDGTLRLCHSASHMVHYDCRDV